MVIGDPDIEQFFPYLRWYSQIPEKGCIGLSKNILPAASTTEPFIELDIELCFFFN